MAKKKRKPYIIKEINKLTLKPNETLMVHFDIENFDIMECEQMFQLISKSLPKENNILGLLGNTKIEIIENAGGR